MERTALKIAFRGDSLVTLSAKAAAASAARFWETFLGYRPASARLPGPARPLPRWIQRWSVQRLAERGANRETRRAACAVVRNMHCERGRGFLVQRSTGRHYPAPCRSWRECAPCARAYGAALASRWSKVTGLRAFVVLTMPAELGDWRVDANRRLMMVFWRRLYERLCRRFGRPKLMHFKEHAGPGGRLHLNVLWDWQWVDQSELSELAAECGFGPICHISRVGRGGRGVELAQGCPGSSAAVHYSAKQGFRVVAYARKTGGQTASGDDWPKRVRRWSSSRAASREMGPRPSNPEWHWAAIEPPTDSQLAANLNSQYAWPLLAERELPCRAAPITWRAPPTEDERAAHKAERDAFWDVRAKASIS
jgi:hypothetical protein